MASSKVMASTSPPNPDLTRQSSPSPLPPNLQSDHSRGIGSMNMEEILKNMYPDSDSFVGGAPVVNGGTGGGEVRNGGNKTVDEVWSEIVAGGAAGGGEVAAGMTLEDFLAKAGAVSEDDVRIPGAAMALSLPQTAVFPVEMTAPATVTAAFPVTAVAPMESAAFPVMAGAYGVGYGNGVVAVGGGTGGGSGRAKRRAAVEAVPLDKATQQKQRRMIKNRESAARSRERKQAYTVELESQVTQLEEENARLLKEEAELNKERYKQLMETLVPVVEKRRPPRTLRRVNSMSW